MTLVAAGVLYLDARCAADWHNAEDAALWQRLLGRGGPVAILVCVLTVAAAREFNKLLTLKGFHPMVRWTASAAGALVLAPWVAAVLQDDAQAGALLDLRITLTVLIVGLLVVTFRLIARRDPTRGLADFGGAVLVMVYCGLFLSFVVRLRLSFPGASGAGLVAVWLLVVKFTDVGAFFTGISFGRRPLIPAISPKKTVEGFVGGLCTGVGVGLLGWFCLPSIQPIFAVGRCPPLLYLIVFSIVMSFLGQIGDLLESLIKRSAQAKDSASLIPTFGGVLDVVDSPVLTAPVAWLMLSPWTAAS